MVKISVGWSTEEMENNLRFPFLRCWRVMWQSISIYMLGAFVEDIIMSNVDSTTIVTIKRNGSGLWSIHVSQEPAKPNKLTSGVGKGTILSLSTGTGNHILLLAAP